MAKAKAVEKAKVGAEEAVAERAGVAVKASRGRGEAGGAEEAAPRAAATEVAAAVAARGVGTACGSTAGHRRARYLA